MIRYQVISALVALTTIGVRGGSAQDSQFPTTPPAPTTLRPMQFPAYQQAKLSNGLDLLVVENRELPVVSITLALPAGAAHEPKGQEGLAEMVAELITKGTKTRTAEKIFQQIEGAGGSLSSEAGADFLTVSTTVLTERVDVAFELLGDVLINATFPDAELELARTRKLSSLKLEASDPGALGERFFAHALYGDHPYGRRPNEASVSGITPAMVRGYAAGRIRPGGALLVVTGDILLADARKAASKYLAKWSGAATPEPALPPLPGAKPKSILLVNRPGSTQSNLLVGNLALRPGDPRFYPLTVGNKLLGGGADSRLFSVLREQKGWTYGASSALVRRKDLGYFAANTDVREPVTDQALAELTSQINRMRTEAVADSEIGAAKGYLVGSFPRQVETPQQVAGQVASAKLLGLGDDYLRTYRDRLNAVTPDDVKRAVAEVIQPDSAVIVVVGDGPKLYDKLKQIAPVSLVSPDGKPLTPDDLTPKAGPLVLDPKQFIARRDSFVVFVQGNPLGTMVNELIRAGDSLVYSEKLSIPVAKMGQETLIRLDPTKLDVRGVDQSGQMAGQEQKLHVVVENGRARGNAHTPQPGGTPKDMTIDTTLAPGTLEATAVPILVPGLALAPGMSFTVNALNGSDGSIKPVTIAVRAVGNLGVPAGVFPVFQVEIQGTQTPMLLYITREEPRRIIKIEQMGRPFSIELVGSRK